MKIFLILSLFSILAHKPNEKVKIEETTNKVVVSWQKDNTLTWDDFRGVPKSGSVFAAECYWEIQYSYSLNPSRNKVHFDVFCYFNASKSWVKPHQKTDGLLQHEQIHFDIAELCSRKLRKKLAQSSFQEESFKNDINIIFDDILYLCDSMQVAYDSQTNHGLNKKQQHFWQENINNNLLDLKEFEKNPDSRLESPLTEENFIARLFRKLNF